MDKFLDGKVAVVTGATRGIGRAIAESLLQSGASVFICGRTQQSVDEAVRAMSEKPGGNIAGKAADIGRLEDVQALFRLVDERATGLDVVVNNAGVGVFRPVADLAPEDWRRVVDTNLNGVYYCCHEAMPRLRARGGGTVINIGSLAGKNAIPGGTAYNASKFGLLGFTEAMMLDHRYDNVRVSTVMPGSVDTSFGIHAQGAEWMIAPEDIAEIVLTILKMPPRTLISRVEVRPTKPKKSA